MKQTLIPWKRNSGSIEDIKRRAWTRGAVSSFAGIGVFGTVVDVASGEWMRAFFGLIFMLASVLALWYYQYPKPGGLAWYVSGDVDVDCTADNMEDVMRNAGNKETEDD